VNSPLSWKFEICCASASAGHGVRVDCDKFLVLYKTVGNLILDRQSPSLFFVASQEEKT
jgi:hypothetical protein